MRVPKKSIRKAFNLLEEIQRNPKYLKWCQDYNPFQKNEPLDELEDRWDEVYHEAYDKGFVIQNYREIVETNLRDAQQVWKGNEEMISHLDEEATLACIAFIFRADHFCEGALMESIANGLLLKYYRRLMEIATDEIRRGNAKYFCCPRCDSVHTAPILWGMPAYDRELERQEANEEIYIGGCCVSQNVPSHHCFSCEWEFIPGEENESIRLTREQILHANQIFSFGSGSKIIHIELEKNNEYIYCCHEGDAHWWIRDAANFWDAWNLDPTLYIPLTGVEAAAIIAEWEGHPEEPVIDQEKLTKAIAFAAEHHAGQLCKGTQIPYITHPMETMCILSAMKADTDLLIAGLLHDTIEDTETTREEIAALFGEDVASLVDAHSEDKSKTWEERKTTAIEELKEAPQRLKMLIMAGKVSNLRCLYRDYCAVGEELWKRFNAPAEKQAWYYGGIQDALENMQDVPEAAPIYWEMVGLYKDLFVTYSVNGDFLYQVCRSGEGYVLTKANPDWKPLKKSVPKTATQISRHRAEATEDIWNEPFWDKIEDDLREYSHYTVYSSPKRTVSIQVKDGKITLLAEDNGPECRDISGGDTYEFSYSLSEEDSEKLIVDLRKQHTLRFLMPTIWKREFGFDDGPKRFKARCEKLGLACRFFAP